MHSCLFNATTSQSFAKRQHQGKNKKTKKQKKNICKAYTHPSHRRLRKKARKRNHSSGNFKQSTVKLVTLEDSNSTDL